MIAPDHVFVQRKFVGFKWTDVVTSSLSFICDVAMLRWSAGFAFKGFFSNLCLAKLDVFLFLFFFCCLHYEKASFLEVIKLY